MSTITATTVTRPAAWPLQFLSVFGLLLMSGALQRPVGGNALQGSVSGTVVQQTNVAIALLGAAFYAVCLALLLFRPGQRVRYFHDMWPLLALNALAIASAFWSVDPQRTLVRSFGLTGCSIFGLFIVNFFTRAEFERHLIAFSAVVIIGSAILAVAAPSYAYHNASEFFALHSGLLRGTFEHKNNFAKVAAVCVVVILALGPHHFGSKLWPLALAAVGCVLLVMAGSAKTLITVPAALAAGYMLLLFPKPSVRAQLIAGALVIWVAADTLQLIDMVTGLLLSALDRDPTLSARTEIWAAAVGSALRLFPILGGGYEAAWIGGIGQAVREAVGFDPSHAHNGFIMSYVEMGLPGLALAIAGIAIPAYRLLSTVPPPLQRHRYVFAAAWLTLFVGNNLSGSYYTLPGDLYWLLMLLFPFLLIDGGTRSTEGESR